MKVGRVRRSTLVLAVIFVAAVTLYFLYRPHPVLSVPGRAPAASTGPVTGVPAASTGPVAGVPAPTRSGRPPSGTAPGTSRSGFSGTSVVMDRSRPGRPWSSD